MPLMKSNHFAFLQFVVCSFVKNAASSPVSSIYSSFRQIKESSTAPSGIQTNEVSTGVHSGLGDITVASTSFTLIVNKEGVKMSFNTDGNLLLIICSIAIVISIGVILLVAIALFSMSQNAICHQEKKRIGKAGKYVKQVGRKRLSKIKPRTRLTRPILEKPTDNEEIPTDTDQSSTTTSGSDSSSSSDSEGNSSKRDAESGQDKLERRILNNLSEKVDGETILRMVRYFLPVNRQQVVVEKLRQMGAGTERFYCACDEVKKCLSNKWSMTRLAAYYESIGYKSYAECVRQHLEKQP